MPTPEPLTEKLPSLWRIAKYFWPHVGKHRGLIATSVLALFAEVGLRLLEPWPLKLVFDRVIAGTQKKHQWLPTALRETDPMTLLALAAVAVVVITGLRALASYWQTIGFTQIGNRVLRTVRARLYRHVQYLSLSFHSKARTGDLVVTGTCLPVDGGRSVFANGY